MLVSHSQKFIFIKSGKTASTSTEILLQKYCVSHDHQVLSQTDDKCDEIVTDRGIIGLRGADARSTARRFFGHMTAMEIRDALPDLWLEYTKVCNIRNPFDILVSEFWHKIGKEQREKFACLPFTELRLRFEEWVMKNPKKDPISKYITINSRLEVDHLLRHESLLVDIGKLYKKLGIKDNIEMPRRKSAFRQSNAHYSRYYSPELASHFSKQWNDMLSLTKYQFCLEKS